MSETASNVGGILTVIIKLAAASVTKTFIRTLISAVPMGDVAILSVLLVEVQIHPIAIHALPMPVQLCQ